MGLCGARGSCAGTKFSTNDSDEALSDGLAVMAGHAYRALGCHAAITCSSTGEDKWFSLGEDKLRSNVDDNEDDGAAGNEVSAMTACDDAATPIICEDKLRGDNKDNDGEVAVGNEVSATTACSVETTPILCEDDSATTCEDELQCDNEDQYGNCKDKSATTSDDELQRDDEDDDAVATTAGVDDVTVSTTARST